MNGHSSKGGGFEIRDYISYQYSLDRIQKIKGRHNYTYNGSPDIVRFNVFALDLGPIRSAARANGLTGGQLVVIVNDVESSFPI